MNAIRTLVPLRSNFPSLENSIIRMVMLVALAEEAVKEDNQAIWLQNNSLNKRREKYHFDKHLQHMINYCEKIGAFKSRVVECGNKSYYKSELFYENNQEEIIVHVHAGFDPTAKYNRKYLDMNADEKKRYAYIEYSLTEQTKTVQALTWIVPDTNGKAIKTLEIDLLPVLDVIRDFIQSQELTIQEMLCQIDTIEYYINGNL